MTDVLKTIDALIADIDTELQRAPSEAAEFRKEVLLILRQEFMRIWHARVGVLTESQLARRQQSLDRIAQRISFLARGGLPFLGDNDEIRWPELEQMPQ